MITKIDIKKFGQFNDFEWNTCCDRDLHFKKLNILYGRNYSGKTTLSRILRCIEKSILHENYCDAEFNILLDDNSTFRHNNLNTSVNGLKVRVYNSDFVKENLSWLHKVDGTIEPFTILGELNVNLNQQIKQIEISLGNVEDKTGLLWELECLKAKFTAANEDYEKSKNDLDAKLRAKAVEIKNEGRIFNVPTYNINSIKADITIENVNKVLDDESSTEKKKSLTELPKGVIQALREQQPHLDNYTSVVSDLVEEQIKISQPIADLLSDTLLQQWVWEGIDKHKGKRNTCGFCGNVITDDLWSRLDNHFNSESQGLRQKIMDAIRSLQQAKQSLTGFIKLSKDDFYYEFQEEFINLTIEWSLLVEQYQESLDSLITALQEKERDIFQSKTPPTVLNNSAQIFETIKELNKLIEKNNSRTSNLSNAQAAARLDLRISEVAKFAITVDYFQTLETIEEKRILSNSLHDQMREKKFEIDTCVTQKEKLQAQANDESRGADLVNQYLSSFFGHSQLKLVAEDHESSVRFSIKRGNEHAFNLSEGEASLISFCYFIARMEDELNDPALQSQLIIYIDDPISSLDSNHVFFMFSLIDNVIAKSNKYLQLFVSTHSLDFLKYLKRLTSPGKKQVSYLLIESRQNENGRYSTILPMPVHLKEYVTEFNYLFNEIHKVYIRAKVGVDNEEAYNQTYNFSNNLRKFLECYLFYKYPNSNEPLKKLDKLFDNNIPSLLNRIVNEYSHLTQIERGWKPLEFYEINQCAEIVLKKIYEKDSEQYLALCESVGIPDEHQIFNVATSEII